MKKDFSEDINKSLEVLRRGGTILYPTDTIWGLGCDATDPLAVERVFELKKRPAEKSMIVLLADERDILRYVAHPDPAIFDFLAKTEKPTTVVYPGALGLADNLLAADGSIGIRICKEAFCRQLIKRFRKPLVSTSANISGQASPAFFHQIDQEILNNVDYAVTYRQDDNTPSSPSSIVKLERGGGITIIRS